MLKNKTHRIRRISSAALIGLAIYGTSVSQVSANSLRYISGGRQQTKIERIVDSDKEGNVIEKGVVVSKDGNKLEVIREKDNLRLSVLIGDQTKIWAGFNQRSSITSILVGDKIGVWGKENILGEGIIQASSVRDFSQKQKRGVYKGEVVEVSDGEFKVLVKGKIIVVGSEIVVENREKARVSLSKVKVGDKVRLEIIGTVFDEFKIDSVQDLSLPRL